MSERAILAGGCFWGMEELYRHLDGVLETNVGYTGGQLEYPTYNDIKTGQTGHAESLEIIFDPARITYRQILEFFFKIHDPTTPNRQGNDRGSQYRSLICYLSDEQKQTAENLIAEAETSKKWPGKIVTEIVPASKFYNAESFHQNYLQNNPGGYTCHFIRSDWSL